MTALGLMNDDAWNPRPTDSVGYGDSGGASRFFYTAKASRSDRGDGNTHPTVKSAALMGWLIRLITPPGGTVLDPFMGSGSTGVAAFMEGFRFVGIESDPDYFDIASKRIAEVRSSTPLLSPA
jgi:site-specific DNA-methyltransferase (adenine-specific)